MAWSKDGAQVPQVTVPLISWNVMDWQLASAHAVWLPSSVRALGKKLLVLCPLGLRLGKWGVRPPTRGCGCNWLRAIPRSTFKPGTLCELWCKSNCAKHVHSSMSLVLGQMVECGACTKLLPNGVTTKWLQAAHPVEASGSGVMRDIALESDIQL
eukprot:189233-Pelagomonas_calceolata.AAC.2